MLVLSNVSAGYSKGENVLKNISCEFMRGTVTAIIGPNGCGKSTLLKVIARQLKISSGTLSLDGVNISEFSPRELAKRISLLPQVRNVPSIPARALVTHGRFPYLSFPRVVSQKDKDIVEKCMRETNTLQFQNKDVASLSGGQRQRVYIAMLLAQQTDAILMDEPTTFLDVSCQYEVLDMIKELRDKGKCVVVVLHDIAQAVRVADRLIMLADEESVFNGKSEDFAKSGALEKYMDLSLHKTTIDGEEISFITKKR